MSVTALKYTGGTPGADANTYTLFTTAALPSNWGSYSCVHTYHYDIKNSQAGTVNGYKSADGVTWHQFYTMAIGIPASAATNNDVVLVEGYRHFKFEFVNGGSAQTTWSVDQDVSTKRAML